MIRPRIVLVKSAVAIACAASGSEMMGLRYESLVKNYQVFEIEQQVSAYSPLAEPDAAVPSNSWAGGTAKYQHPGYADLAQRMEIIAPTEIQLIKFLGAGGYGEVRLASSALWFRGVGTLNIIY